MAYTPGSASLLKVTISASLTTIAQQVKFGAFVRKRNRIEVTGLADTFEVLKPGIKRFDGIAFEGWYDPANATHQYLLTSYAGSLTEVWQALSADAGAATLDFSGWLEELSIGEFAVDGYVTISGLIVPTTDISITP